MENGILPIVLFYCSILSLDSVFQQNFTNFALSK